MKTIRIPDPFPRGKAARKLEWGSSAWAADSCLVEWSQLEREWLGVPAGEAPATGASTHRSTALPRRLRRAGLAVLAVLVAGAVVAWFVLGEGI